MIDALDVEHHFGGGTYCKLALLPANHVFEQHRHKFDHLSSLCQGEADVTVDGQTERYIGPAVLTIAANKVHSVRTYTPVVWACIHATAETDPENIDHELVAESNPA